MRLASILAIAAAVLATGSTPANAQSFLEGLARRAVDRAVGEAARRGEDSEPTTQGTQGDPARAAPPTRGGRAGPTALPEGPAPWPTNAGQVTYTGDLEFDPAYEARLREQDQFARSRCMGCEGGYQYDTMIEHHVDASSEGGVAGRAGRMAVGDSFSWRGEISTGVFEVISDASIGEFPCRQVRVTMTKGEETMEALRLYCLGKTHAYDRNAWARVL